MHNIEGLLEAVSDDVLEWRRHLHKHPELSFEEHETSRFITSILGRCPDIQISHPAGTSVVGRLVGGRPGPVVALRADFDALPIKEETGLTYASVREGVMHACGHDGHTAILLGVAQVLAKMKADLAGEVRFLFQHAEETYPGGARGMIAAGVMDKVDHVIGLHLWAPYEIGTVQVNRRHVMAACDGFRIEVKGKGGHIGVPNEAVDPIAIGAQIISNLQHLVAREISPLKSAVVGVTGFQSGISIGVIPPTAILTGGANMFDPDVRDLIERRIGEIATTICAAHGAQCNYEYQRVYDPVINDASLATLVGDVSSLLFGRDNVKEMDPIMPGEDFSFFGQKAPSCFVLLGAGNKSKGITAPHHDGKFQIDEDALVMGTRLFVYSVLELMQQSPQPN